ncbi:Peptide chain release factor 1-like, mitochondrial [Saguinus oedipus]|uniref:Peptide chain release factor 1-like, mitochondrial n=1 Tax=Saguinus oedipus TaxID=9490 RepID=A0ABQ9U4U6_SAGOE|nr:Peptide chain release factor 1-like, mitochondrial [Saguinus oedipus]
MWSSLLWCAARLLWPCGAVGTARRPLSGDSRLLEELFAQGGSLQTFLERQAGSEAHLKVRRPELVAVVKLLNKKEKELRETKHLLHNENEDLRKLGENEITLCQKEITQMKHQKKQMKMI